MRNGNGFGFQPDFSPYQPPQPSTNQPASGTMQQYAQFPQQQPGDQNPLDGGYTPQNPNVGGADYLTFLQKMAGKKAF